MAAICCIGFTVWYDNGGINFCSSLTIIHTNSRVPLNRGFWGSRSMFADQIPGHQVCEMNQQSDLNLLHIYDIIRICGSIKVHNAQWHGVLYPVIIRSRKRKQNIASCYNYNYHSSGDFFKGFIVDNAALSLKDFPTSTGS